MNRVTVYSSDIRSVGYENFTLEIEFKRGEIYRYQGVPEEKYSSLITSASCESYFHHFIKPYYPAIKIR